MSTSHNVYEKVSDYKMDPKYRVSIPAEWRSGAVEIPVRLQLSKEQGYPVIKVFTPEEFDLKYEKVRVNTVLTEAEKQQLVGHLRMSSKMATISPQGKLTIPKDWAERIGVKADGPVTLGGRGPYYILCSQENYYAIFDAGMNMNDGGTGVL